MFPPLAFASAFGSAFAPRPIDDILDGTRRSPAIATTAPGARKGRGRSRRGAHRTTGRGHRVGERDAGLVRVDPGARAAPRRRRVTTVAVAVALLSAIGTSLVLRQRFITAADRAQRYEDQLASAAARVDRLAAESAEQLLLVSSLETRLTEMHDRVAEIRASKVRTVVKTEVVTKKVPRWVPNGKRIEVDTTGFEDRIAIHDVQLTRAYGYSHLIGIAINRSAETLSYAQLGCTFVDADGRLLANEMVNKATWAPGQRWGFDCSAQVDATGGMLRVDEMT
jgi:hypothetical protein